MGIKEKICGVLSTFITFVYTKIKVFYILITTKHFVCLSHRRLISLGHAPSQLTISFLCPKFFCFLIPDINLFPGENRDLGENIERERERKTERKKERKKDSKRVRRYNIMFSYSRE